MREVEFAQDTYSRYKPRKTLKLSTAFFIYALDIVLLFIGIITKNKLIMTKFFILFSFIVNYHMNLLTFRLDLGQEVFLSLLLTRAYGLAYGLSMIVISEVLADIVTGRLDKDTVLSIFLSIILNAVFVFFNGMSFVLVGAAFVVIKFVISLMVNLSMGLDLEELIFETGLNFVTNMLLFLTFGDFFLRLLTA